MEEKITDAKIQLIRRYPFFGRLCVLFKFKVDDRIPTAGTDGKTFYYNPEFLAGISRKEILGVMAHEVLHAGLGHIWRRGQRDPHKWNIAADYAVNVILKANNIVLPPGALYQYQYSNLSAEEIYDRLPVKMASCAFSINNFGGRGKEGTGVPVPMEGKNSECPCSRSHRYWKDAEDAAEGKSEFEAGRSEGKSIQDVWESAVRDGWGDAPAGMARIFEFLEPEKNWREVLSAYLSVSRDDFDFMRRDRRTLSSPFYFPELSSDENLEDVVVAIDTSGSISSGQLSKFVSEFKAIIGAFPVVKGWLVDCDARVGEWRPLQSVNKDIKLQGGGGTDFRPVFDRIDEEGVDPKVVVFFTDGYGTYPEDVPNYPVLWLLTESYATPFGRNILLRDGI